MRIQAIAFDLGNTLVEYYEREAFPSVLRESIAAAHAVLSPFASWKLEEAQTIAVLENHEDPDGKVRPLQERLDKIFGLTPQTPLDVRADASSAFLQPIFDRARRYPDSVPMLRMLRQQGYKLAIVSNTPWGSPSLPWREELRRHDLLDAVDVSIFCVDGGWRKPAQAIFQQVLDALKVTAEECLFVGDEPVWDVEGANAAGMPAMLIDRSNRHAAYNGTRIQSLQEIVGAL